MFGDPLVVSSGTHQKIRETLVRFFRNASTKSGRPSCVSSLTRQKDRDTRARLLRNAPKKTMRETSFRFFRNAPRSRRDTSVFLQESANRIGETLPRFFWNAQKISVKHSCVSSATRPKNQRDTRAFLQERAKETMTQSRVSSVTRKKIGEALLRFFRNAPNISASYSCIPSGTRPKNQRGFFRNAQKKSEKCSRVSSGTHQKNTRHTRGFFSNILNDFGRSDEDGQGGAGRTVVTRG